MKQDTLNNLEMPESTEQNPTYVMKNLKENNSDQILRFLTEALQDGRDTTADVLIYCSNGVIPTHRLLLASISDMLLTVFKQDTWDEQIVIMLPDFSTSDLTQCIKSLLMSSKSEKLSDVFNVLGFSTMPINSISSIPRNSNVENANANSNKVILYPRRKEKLKNEVSDCDVEVKLEIQNENDDLTELEDNLQPKKGLKTEETNEHNEIYGYEDANNDDVDDDDDYDDDETYELEEKMQSNKKIKERFLSGEDNLKKKKKKKRKILERNKKAQVWNFFDVDHDAGTTVCKVCQGQVAFPKNNSSSNMTGHMRRNHPEIFTTLTRKKVGTSQMDPEVQQYCEEHPSNPAKRICKLCKIVISYENFVRHVRRKHLVDQNKPLKEWLCSQCGKVFNDKWNRDHHERKIHFGDREKCTYCGKEFYSLFGLKNHMRIHTGEEPDKSFQCHDCGSQFSSKISVDSHIKNKVCLKVSLVGSYNCPSCKKEFSTMHKLKGHVIRSSLCSFDNEKKPFPCQYCEKSFMTEKYLEIHTRTHTGDKPFQCEKCSKRFQQLTRLKYHNCINA